MLQQGLGVCEVARHVGVWPGSVVRWRDAYREAGEQGLRAKPHPGAKPKLPADRREELAELLLKGPLAHGYPTDLWTLQRVAKLIEKHFGVRYHPSSVWRLLQAIAWTSQKPERRARERDEQAIGRWRRKDWPRIKKSPPQALERGFH
jgi:transposase